MFPSHVVTTLWLFGLPFAAALLFGAAALWAVSGRGHWLVRIAPVTLLLAALAPVGAYELIAVFGAQSAVIIGWVLLGRLAGRSPRTRDESSAAKGAVHSDHDAIRGRDAHWGQGARFQIRALLEFVLLVGGILAIARYAAPVVAATGGTASWGACVLIGVASGLLLIAVEWTVFGKARWFVRLPALALGAIALGAVPRLFGGLNVLVGMGFVLGVAAAMALLGAAGWTWWRRAMTGSAAEESTGRPTRPWWQWPARAATACVVLGGISAIVGVYWAILPTPAPAIELPKPNGYDELTRIASAINWSAIPTQDHETANAKACKQFVLDNDGEFQLLRDALRMPSKVPIEFSPNFMGVSLPNIQDQRELGRALSVVARLATLEGRYADAADSYLAIVRLGNTSARGGLLVHELAGLALGGVGLDGMASTLPKVDAAELADLRRGLIEAADDQEPFDQILDRERVFAPHTGGWLNCIWLYLDPAALGAAIDATERARQRHDALLRLFLAEAAVRQYVLEHGVSPPSLAELVPDYFGSVPDDPLGDGPLKYRRIEDGYLLYSVGNNGRDDGGLRATKTPATTGTATDLFFDAPEN
jgi:hypothetical protein